ncbi:MAG: hypothetical protein NT141_03825 [candidate division WWE3 bacterium]|nr:hypothetical protein [candidate division WWE3 bacterium]
MSGEEIVSIVDAIHVSSITLLVPLIDKYPILKDILNKSKSKRPADDWDFFMTAAGSGLVLTSDETYKGEHEKVLGRASEINKDIPRAIDDFISFTNKNKGKEEMVATTIGLWVLWNLKQEEPTYDETKELAPIIGNFLLKLIADWRNSPKT